VYEKPPTCAKFPPLMTVPAAGSPIVPLAVKLPPELLPPPPAITLRSIASAAGADGCWDSATVGLYSCGLCAVDSFFSPELRYAATAPPSTMAKHINKTHSFRCRDLPILMYV